MRRRWLVLVPALCFACKPKSEADANRAPACDTDKLRATSTAITELPASERGRAAWDGLKAACGESLPAPFVAHYEAKDPRKIERLQNPVTQDAGLEPLIRKACGDWDTLRAIMQDAPADQRGMGSYSVCGAERYDVIERDEARGFASTEVTWALHQWLLDQGIEPPLAKPITRAMLAYEAELGSPIRRLPGLALPSAVGGPLGEAVAVYVSPQEIRVGGEAVVKLDGTGHAAADALRSSPLAATLTRALEQAAAATPDDPPVAVVAADARTPSATMLDLLDTLGMASAAGLESVALAVDTPEQGITLLRLKTSAHEQPDERPPAMTVEITREGMTASSPAEEQPVTIGHGDSQALTSFARKVDERFVEAETVIISADPELALQQVVDVIAAARGSCEHDYDEDCVLPFALLSRTPAHQHVDADADVWGGGDPELYGVGGLGLVDGDEGEPAAAGSASSKITQGEPKITGKLDDSVITRIVRAHQAEVQECHEQGLRKDPSLAGRVAINFVITGTGKVGSAVVEESTLDESSVANCIAKAVKRWRFPKPDGGGNVIVTYPFTLALE